MSDGGRAHCAPRYTCNSPGVGRTAMRRLSTMRAAAGGAITSCQSTFGHEASACTTGSGAKIVLVLLGLSLRIEQPASAIARPAASARRAKWEAVFVMSARVVIRV